LSATIHQLVPAETGWRAYYRGEFPEDRESARVVAWALVDAEGGGTEVVGLVVAGDEPDRIVQAPEGASAVAPDFERYGFRED
jgi:hypothetical protein